MVGKPVVIGGDGDPTKRGVVSTASYEAREYGIHSAMPLRTVIRLCPESIFLPIVYEKHVKVSEKIKGILHRFTFSLEDVGIDEALLNNFTASIDIMITAAFAAFRRIEFKKKVRLVGVRNGKFIKS